MRLSKTKVQKFRLCPKKYELSYLQNIWPIYTSDQLEFGKAWANGMELYWGTKGSLSYDELPTDQGIVLGCMLDKYTELYPTEDYQVTGTEIKKTVKINDRTELVVVFDAHVVYKGHGLLVENKTTRQDITSDWYWEKLELDLQTGIYFWAANELGIKTDHVLYCVSRVPSLRQGKVGRKSIEETEEEFKQRVAAELDKNPDKYFQRRIHTPNTDRAGS